MRAQVHTYYIPTHIIGISGILDSEFLGMRYILVGIYRILSERRG